jgi:putative membrane protein
MLDIRAEHREQEVGPMMDRYDGMSGGDWWWMGFMMLFWLAVLVLLVWAVLRLSRAIESHHGTAGGAGTAHHRESPRETLDRRYAAGEIDSAAYREMRARLEGKHPDAS